MRRLPIAVVCVLACAGIAAGASHDVTAVYYHAADVNAACFIHARDNTTYVSTGDIDAMWLRDSSVQATSFVGQNDDLVRGVIARQERMIDMDAYANAFYADYRVAEEKFELDSLAYPVRLVDKYFDRTHDWSVIDHGFQAELHHILNAMSMEMDHARRSQYHNNEHSAASGIGLIWSAYRASDDPQIWNYNIPENMMAAVMLHRMARWFVHFREPVAAQVADHMAWRIENAVRRYGIINSKYGRVYAYEVNGRGRYVLMDDANMPSLLSIPLLGYPYDPGVYSKTRAFVLSPDNPYYYKGRFAWGIGSSHTPANFVWPMALVVQYRTSSNSAERAWIVRQLATSSAGDGALHESFHVDNPHRFTRARFGWVNALFDQTFR